MADTTASVVADAFLAVSQADDEYITNLKLQKLLYYAQGWHLAERGRPLFDDPIEAWPRGPVVPDVFQRFSRFGWRPVEADDEPGPVSRAVLDHVREVWDGYGVCTARQLEFMTTREQPWLVARAGAAADELTGPPIAPADMTDFFRREAAELARQDAARAQT